METAERTKDSRLARQLIVALPVELGQDDWLLLLRSFIQTECVDKGMCADFAIHDPDGHNPHAHIMLTMRPLDAHGKWQSKTQKEYLCRKADGERGFTAQEFLQAKEDGWEMAHERIMAQALEPFKDKYDYCLIDCMPSLGILTVASLVAADRVLIPVQAQHFALKGVVSLLKSINQITRRIKPELEIDGIVLTMVDRRTNLSKDVCAALRSSYGHALKIYRTEIPISTRTAESASSAHSVLSYDASGPASIAYKTLAKEVVDNERVRQQHHTPLTR